MAWLLRSLASPSVSSGQFLEESVAGRVQAGSAHSSVEKELKDEYGAKAFKNILTTSRLKEVVYCKRNLSAFADEKDRPPSTILTHDFLVLLMTAMGRHDKDEITFFIKAEKTAAEEAAEETGEAAGKDEDTGPKRSAGIYVCLLEDKDVDRIEEWCFTRWDCDSIQVPLHGLIKSLTEQDPDYALLTNNCWKYAKETCKSILKFLAEQPNLPPLQSKSYWLEKASEVKVEVNGKIIKKVSEKIIDKLINW